ncbi:MAG: GTP-binding protein [Microbacterium sp.]
MDQVDVVAVVGACAPERQRYTLRLSAGTRRTLIPATRLETEPEPALTAASLVPWADQSAGAVVEFPSTVPSAEIIGALTDPEAATRLIGMICVVDAAHLLEDLAVDDFLVSERDAFGEPTDYVARASLTVTQLEYASMIVLVGWEAIPTPELSTVMALISALAPHARLRLDQDGVDCISPDHAFTSGQDRAGWVSVLNGDADPHMTDPRVGAFRYEQLRPFHPQRLSDVLMHRFDTGEFGQVVRSAGFCRLASRPRTVLQWDHVGRTIAFHIASESHEQDAELLAVGQDLAFIGLDLDRAALAAALDQAALTDEELTAGPAAWARYADPFPASVTADDSTR